MCGQVSTGAVDDIKRCSSLAYQTVSEFGLSAAVGPLSVPSLTNGGSDDVPLFGRDSGAAQLVLFTAQERASYLEFLLCLESAAHVCG